MRHIGKLFVLLALGLAATSCASPAEACSALAGVADGRRDATAALDDCLKRTPAKGRLELPRGTYRLERPLVLSQAVTLTTEGTTSASKPCAASPSACANLVIDPKNGLKAGAMPVEVAAGNVAFDRIVVRGVEPGGRFRASCAHQEKRPMAGGVRVDAVGGFTVTRSVFKDFTCYTPMEITTGAHDLRIEDNLFGPNGNHGPGDSWSDGLTVHDAIRAVVRRNRFFDNTDVQLIFGGCVDCRIEQNTFRHSGLFERAAYAELIVHSWPQSSGNYRGTMVANNDIDCGAKRRCGFGILIGGAPWYPSHVEGGTVTGNVVRNALMGFNIDGLTGPMDIRGNRVLYSGGRWTSDCGKQDWPAINIAPSSRRFVRGDPAAGAKGSLDTKGCILSRVDE